MLSLLNKTGFKYYSFYKGDTCSIELFCATFYRNSPTKNHWIADSYCWGENAYLQSTKL